MGLREQVSLLLAHGHPDARFYPVPKLWTETRLVRKRVNHEIATTATLTQMAINAALSDKGAKAFTAQIKQMTGK